MCGVCVCVCVCQRKTKDRADGMSEKVPISLDGIQTCISGIRAHRATDYTTRAGTPRISSNKHFRNVCVYVCQRKAKDRADGMREKVPIPLDGIQTCISGIRAHMCVSNHAWLLTAFQSHIWQKMCAIHEREDQYLHSMTTRDALVTNQTWMTLSKLEEQQKTKTKNITPYQVKVSLSGKFWFAVDIETVFIVIIDQAGSKTYQV